ncbi:uncharacterized protein F5891DRAFT_980234 [Suillus fuscotomentosus]|uniref:Uncharacterized protein n=1 Tax=Suillus fuscotomentosus TaxID=1912939 RepID=A0AAD4E6J0_9AGAM|nr:uncharacterized protein F5891DRAFT_980234 [Suillus fuscotomentosus]KAG1900655.1 hypothetical protein F5891DRAFT_980234 [Suillus fuscotomentosus]
MNLHNSYISRILVCCPLSVIYNITIISWRNSVRQHVSRATYYCHAKYRAPKASVFDKTLTTLIQANSANSNSVQLNDSDTDVQPAHQHILKRRRIDSGTHALSNDNQIIPAGDALEEHNDVPQVHLDVFEHYDKQIIPAGDALEERNDVHQVTWMCMQGKTTQTDMQGRMTLLSCRIMRTPRDMTETRTCHPMSPRRKKFKGALMMLTLEQTIPSD